MADVKVKLGDIGTAVEVTVTDQDGVAVSLAAASALKMRFQRPDETVFEKTAVLVTDGVDGKVHYITIAGDIDQIGTWQVMVKVTLPGGTWSTDIHKMKVGKVI